MVGPLHPLDRKLLRDLWHLRGQALSIGILIACGVAIVIMSIGAMRSLEETRAVYYERYRFAHVFAGLKRAPERVAHEIARIPGVAAVATRISNYATLDIAGLTSPAVGRLLSLTEDGGGVNAIHLVEGRRPRPARDEVVLSQNIAAANGLELGGMLKATINGKRRELTVVGIALSPEFVFILGPGQLVPDDRTFGILWMDRETLAAAYDLTGAFNDVAVRLMYGASVDDVIARLDTILDPYGGTGAYAREDQTSNAYLDQELQQLWTMATIIPPIFLAVAAFLLNVIMSRLVATEREQIGLMKAFGYSDAAIGWHYLKFTAFVAALGIAIGLGLGVWLGEAVTVMYQQYFRFPLLYFRSDPHYFGGAIAITVAAASLGAWGAARNAMALRPAVAMSPPAPPVYRRTVVEWLSLSRIVSAPTHMIVRHIQRWPWRSLVTGFGVAASFGLMVMLLANFDAIDEMIDSFYFRANRQDATVKFVDPRDPRALGEVARLPGVRLAEPIREVPVRLRNGHVTELIALTGVEHGATLRTFTDSNGVRFAVPRAGVVLSDKLARMLQVEAGEILRIDVLEGRRRKTEVRVAGVVPEFVGLAAYIDIGALDRLTGDARAYTGARVMIDGMREAEFVSALKEVPGAGSALMRSTATASFRKLLAENIYIIISFYIGFGAAITYGVVYNAARISLSERGREMASLRVLGFTRGETAYILLGELAILVLAALPFGCVFGYGLAFFVGRAMETEIMRIPFVVSPATYGAAAVAVLIAAALSAIAVAWRVVRLDLIRVLKTRE